MATQIVGHRGDGENEFAHADREQPSYAAADATWTGPCGARNSSNSKFCAGCGTPKPADGTPGQDAMLERSSTMLGSQPPGGMISDRQEDQSQGFENTSMLAVGKCYEKLTCLIGGAGAAKGPMCCIPMACLGGVVGGILGAEGGMIIPFGVAGCCIAGSSGKNLVDVQAGHVGVVLRFGRYHKLLPPGRHRINVMSDVVTEVATRVAVCDVPPQAVLTSDNLAITADAALYYSVSDAAQATFAVDDFRQALQNLGQVTMRAVIGEFTLEAIFAKRIELNERIKAVCSEQASTWGIVIDEIVLQSVKLPNDLEERLAAVAQSKREAEAQMIKAEADKAVAAINSEAAKIIKETPAALDLKWMETLKAVAANPARTIIVPPTQGNSLTLLPGLR